MATLVTGMAAATTIEKLRGFENYPVWKFLVRMILVQDDLWDAVESKQEESNKTQQKALARICLMVEPNVLSHIRNAKTAYEAWNNLQKVYEDKGLCRRLGLLRSLFALKLDGYSSMQAYLSKVCDISQQLQDIDAPLDDDFVAVIMLSGLPTDYDPLIMAIENSNLKLTSELVRSKLTQECQRREETKPVLL